MKKIENEIIRNENLIEIEELSQHEMDEVSGGKYKCLGKKYKTVTLKRVDQSKIIYSLRSIATCISNSNSKLVQASYWGGQGGIKIVRKSAQKGRAIIRYTERLIVSADYYDVVVTVNCI